MKLDENRWYRVQDSLPNPLNGCDVLIKNGEVPYVVALRRVDVFAGDRPYQIRNGAGLGVYVHYDALVDSPIQDEIVELATDNPYGKFIDTEQINNGFGTLTTVMHEKALQVALAVDDGGRAKTFSKVFFGDKKDLRKREKEFLREFDNDPESLIFRLEDR